MLFTAMILALFGLAYSLLTAKAAYQPIRRLVESVSGEAAFPVQHAKNENELDYLKELFSRTVADRKSMISTMSVLLPALMLPIIIIVGILSGIFTATEAGSVAVLYAAVLGIVTKELKLKDVKPIMMKAARSTTNVLLLMATGATLGWILTKNQVPQKMTMALLGITRQPVLLMVIIIAFVLFLGCFLTDATIVPILTPLVLPVVRSIGYDPIAFGVILCTISVVGNLTPPVGGLLFVVSGIGDIPVGKIARTVLPFLGVIVGVLVLCSIFPSIISFIPNRLL